MRDLPTKLVQAEKEAKDAVEKHSQAVQLLPIYENISRVKQEELPKLK